MPAAGDAKSTEALLRLCSHFNPEGGDAGSAKERCESLLATRQRDADKSLKVLQLRYRAIDGLGKMLESCPPPEDGAVDGSSEWKTSLQAAEQGYDLIIGSREVTDERDKCISETPRQMMQMLSNKKNQKCLGSALVETAAAWWSSSDLRPQLADVRPLLSEQVHGLAADLKDYRVKKAMRDRCMQEMSKCHQGLGECSVCLNDQLPLKDWRMINRCGHVACEQCLMDLLKQGDSARCPECRHAFRKADIKSLKQAEAGQASSEQFGSKLSMLAAELKKLREEDRGAQVVVFAQWDDLKRKAAAALVRLGLPVMTIQGNPSQRGKLLSDWSQSAPGSSFVLLLSLKDSAEGKNLQMASHVVFLHPMLAGTCEEALSHEKQAIGRVRRQGQRRSHVHVWRFVTVDTIEVALTSALRDAHAGEGSDTSRGPAVREVRVAS